jgi:DNA-binding CsgD family transcriptional regulator
VDKPIIANSLNQFTNCEFEFGFPLKYLNGGLALWDADLHCQHMNDYLRDILGIPYGPIDKWDPSSTLLDREFLGKAGQLSAKNTDGWQTRKTYITDKGVRFIDMVVRPIQKTDGTTLGYLSVCQDVTSHHEPLVFQGRLNGLLRCVAMNDSPDTTAQVIYDCTELLGFRDATIVVFDTNVNKLEVAARITRGYAQEKEGSWSLEVEVDHNPLIKATREFLKTGKISNMIFNDTNNSGWDWAKCPYACLPIIHENNLLGFLVLAQSHCFSLTPELLDSAGRTTLFLRDLSPVFKRVYIDPRNSDVYRKWALMRERLERMNLNQKQITILEMIAKGETNKGIAHVVNLSEQGVKYHVGNLLEIFQTKNRLELRSKLHKIMQTA